MQPRFAMAAIVSVKLLRDDAARSWSACSHNTDIVSLHTRAKRSRMSTLKDCIGAHALSDSANAPPSCARNSSIMVNVTNLVRESADFQSTEIATTLHSIVGTASRVRLSYADHSG